MLERVHEKPCNICNRESIKTVIKPLYEPVYGIKKCCYRLKLICNSIEALSLYNLESFDSTTGVVHDSFYDSNFYIMNSKRLR
jgi:hypothetical protein